MAWLKIDDRVRTHPKILEAGPAAAWVWFCGICYCREHLTDGFIPDKMLATLVPGMASLKKAAGKLVDARLWHRVERGYQVHDFLEWNPSKQKVEAYRAAENERKRLASGPLSVSDSAPEGGPESDRSPDRTPTGGHADARARRAHGGSGLGSEVLSDGGRGETAPRVAAMAPGLIASPKAWGNTHSAHIVGFCDWLCLPADIFGQFATRLGSEAAGLAWATSVRAGFEARKDPPKGKPWTFWTEQFDARPKDVTTVDPMVQRGKDFIAEQDRIHASLPSMTPAEIRAALRSGLRTHG